MSNVIRPAIEYTLARTRNELLSLKGKENIHIKTDSVSLTDMLRVLQNNPYLRRVEIPEYVYRALLNKSKSGSLNPLMLDLLNIRGIEIKVNNITRKKPGKLL